MNPLDARRRLLGRNVYKKTVEGNPAIATGSLARMYPGITMQGWTEQAQYKGNQLLDASVFNGKEKPGVSVSVDNGVITASGMSETDIWIESTKFAEEDLKKIKSGNIYVKNYKSADCNYECGIYIYNTTVLEGNSPLNIPEGYLETNPKNVYFYINIKAGVELKGTIQPMIYQDGNGDYEPYTGGQPSPSPDYPQEIVSAGDYDEGTGKYQYEVNLTGKNLWDKEKAQNLDNWVPSISQNGYSDFAIEVEAGSKITISTDEIKPLGLGYFMGIVLEENGPITNWLYHSTSEPLIHEEVTVTSLSNKIWIRCATSTILNDFLPNNPYFQVEYGEEKTAYEPYRTPQTVTLTSDRPLTKWDKLEKRNGQWGWVYKSAEVVLDGSEIWMPYPDFAGYYSASILPFSSTRREGYSDRGYVGYYTDRFNIWIGAHNPKIYACFAPTYNAELEDRGVGNWKSFLSENPITIITYLDEETFVPLSETEQEQMNALYTFRPTTVLSNDQECEMTLTYKTRKSMEVK